MTAWSLRPTAIKDDFEVIYYLGGQEKEGRKDLFHCQFPGNHAQIIQL